jgi:hypothetical protein
MWICMSVFSRLSDRPGRENSDGKALASLGTAAPKHTKWLGIEAQGPSGAPATLPPRQMEDAVDHTSRCRITAVGCQIPLD